MNKKIFQISALSDPGKYQLLLESITDYAIYMLDEKGCVASWNAGARRFKGYEEAEILGQHFSRFYTEEDRAAGLPGRALATAAQEGRFEGEGWRVKKDGTRFWTHVIIDPIRRQDGQLIGYAKVTRDLTERKLHQKSLEEAREALFQSQKMEAVGQLTGGVAHDFNNLLMAIQSSLDLLRRRLPDDPKIRSLMDTAMQGVQRGAALTQRMLAFARRQELRIQAVDVALLIQGMGNLLQRSLGPQIRTETRFALGLRPVAVDVNHLESAVLNLAVNARDAMPSGGTLLFSAREATLLSGNPLGLRPGDYVCLSVTDTGEGMDEATRNRAVEPFFTTKGVGKGTGLGLSMVHGFAEQSGGCLVLKSRKGEGTTAEIWLPASTTPLAPADETGEITVPVSRPLRVLAVDDDPLVLTNMTAMLEDLGHSVAPAASAEEALSLQARDPAFDLVITDQAMPGMTGLQLAQVLAARLPDLPVLLVTGFAEGMEEMPAGLKRLMKPFNQDDLARAILELVASD